MDRWIGLRRKEDSMAESSRKYTGAAGICLAAALFGVATGGVALAQTKAPVRPETAQVRAKTTGQLILGPIDSITVSDMTSPSSGGRMVVGGKQITIPDNLLIGLPKSRITLRNLVLEAPEACKSQQPPQSGLAVSDSCRKDKPPALARVVASPDASGEMVASLVMVQKDSARTLARFEKVRRPRRARSAGDGAGTYATQPMKPPK